METNVIVELVQMQVWGREARSLLRYEEQRMMVSEANQVNGTRPEEVDKSSIPYMFAELCLGMYKPKSRSSAT